MVIRKLICNCSKPFLFRPLALDGHFAGMKIVDLKFVIRLDFIGDILSKMYKWIAQTKTYILNAIEYGFCVWFSWKSHVKYIFFSCHFFSVICLNLKFGFLPNAINDILFRVCLCRSVVGSVFWYWWFLSRFLVKFSDAAKNDAWLVFCVHVLLLLLALSLPPIRIDGEYWSGGAFSFPTSTSVWVKVHQDLMKSACTAY